MRRVARYWLEHGIPRPENRGGDQRSPTNSQKKEAIKRHIESFRCKASHYARRGAPGRKYLPCDMNVKKMHDLFMEQNHEQVTYGLYYSVFVYNFNLSFGNPAKDVCGTCMRYKMRLRDKELTDDERKESVAHFIVHRRFANQFYRELNNTENATTLCFDMMENLVLPKTSIGQAFYSRQLYLYVFCVVNHRGEGQPHNHR